MLKPAQFYEETLRANMISTWYKPENIYYHGGTGEYSLSLPDNNANCHCFVSVDKEDTVIGYISYNVDWSAMSADNWGIISFDNEWICPRCGARYEVNYDDYDYCPNCGQHIDWSEEV